jgi:flavodoxin
MNTIVLYDSRFSHTEHLAREIAEKLKEHGEAGTMRIDAFKSEDLARADLLVVGAPSDGFGLTPAIEEFLENVPPSSLLGKHVAVFDTRQRAPWLVIGSAAQRIARRMRGMGAVLVAGPISFFVTSKEGPIDVGEELKADEWAHLVVEKSRNLN